MPTLNTRTRTDTRTQSFLQIVFWPLLVLSWFNEKKREMIINVRIFVRYINIK